MKAGILGPSLAKGVGVDMAVLRRMVDNFHWLVGQVNEYTGRAISFLIPLMTIIICCDVFMRSLFKRPVFWALEINTYLLAGLVMLGGGYTLLHDGHVKVDLLYKNLSARLQAGLDMITYLLFFLFVCVLLWKGWHMAAYSFAINEASPEATGIPIGPSKLLIPVGAALIFLQGVSKYIKTLGTIFIKKKQISGSCHDLEK